MCYRNRSLFKTWEGGTETAKIIDELEKLSTTTENCPLDEHLK